MKIDVVVPSVGESIQEAILAEWFKQDGDSVKKDDPLFVIETDKVTLEVVAEADGTLKILTPADETVAIGAKVGEIEASETDAKSEEKAGRTEADVKTDADADQTEEAAPETETKTESMDDSTPSSDQSDSEADQSPPVTIQSPSDALPPSVRRLIAEKGLDANQIRGSGPSGRITKGDVWLHIEQTPSQASAATAPPSESQPAEQAPADEEVRKPMTPIRKRIAARLLESKQNTAMLTTFNEIDMSRAMAIRADYKEAFSKRHNVSLGFMSFFIKACVEALKEIPEINAYIDGDDIIYHNHQHIGVAIGSKRGLVVPVIRYADQMSFAQIEQAIVDYVDKIKANKLELADLEGGTFTVSNGGVYGSLLSTPILNTPQSGILGMHKIEKRPVVIEDEIVIRPMMYVALSYDHRIVDGKGAVTYLKRVKEFVENPERMILEV